MSRINIDSNERTQLDLNEYEFYYYMPDSESVKNELGYFLKNNSIETYSYVTPTAYGEENFDSFLNFAFSYFQDGKTYFIVKHFNNDKYMMNSKILRQRKFIPYHLDTSLMVWDGDNIEVLESDSLIELEKLNSSNIVKWVDVFFDSFMYPNRLRKYITRMVTVQEENGIEFYIGYARGKDVSCFCSYKSESYYGIYGVGTRVKFRRRGYAKTMMLNYINETSRKDSSAKFCLQAQRKTGAEQLYLNIGFRIAYLQKRFDWDPSTSSSRF